MEDAIFANRKHLTPEQSIKTLYDYARLNDARQRQAYILNVRSRMFILGLIGTPLVMYIGYGLLAGTWANLSPGTAIVNFSTLVNTQARQRYRPEMYLRDQSAKDIIEDRANKTNPLNLWH